MFIPYLLGLAGVRSLPRPYQRLSLLVEAISRGDARRFKGRASWLHGGGYPTRAALQVGEIRAVGPPTRTPTHAVDRRTGPRTPRLGRCPSSGDIKELWHSRCSSLRTVVCPIRHFGATRLRLSASRAQ